MATVTNTARLSARLASRYAPRCAPRRGFKAAAQSRAAQNFTMPALSPTMTEGSIASWNVKEGDSFSTGDVLCEIETDKATMDVEAQDDGILFKITKAEGSKGIQVGERIAVFAEIGDDLSSLEMPAEEKSATQQKPAKEEESAPPQEASSESTQKEQERTPHPGAGQQASPTKGESTEQQGGAPHKQTRPLYPAVAMLLHENGYSNEEAAKITGTGPQKRILKGDVLAYLGRINKDYPAQAAERLDKLSHLDLSNVQVSQSKNAEQLVDTSKSSAVAGGAAPELLKETEIAVPISLSAVIATQKRVQDTLGIFLPLSTFIARASKLANEGLPASKTSKPTADDLFNSVLGLDRISPSSRGHFIPQITGISTRPVAPVRAAKKPDIIDILAPKAARAKAPRAAVVAAEVGVSTGANVFSVTTKLGDESRATEYLERMKLALEKEPGRLVL